MTHPHRSYVLASVEPSTGTLRRYEVGGERQRLTHVATSEQPETFSAQVVEDFRTLPDAMFAIGFDSPSTMVFA